MRSSTGLPRGGGGVQSRPIFPPLHDRSNHYGPFRPRPGLSAPGRPQQRDGNNSPRPTKTSNSGELYVDFKDTETLRRLMSGNGKMNSRRRNGASAMQQRMISTAIKRARIMGLLPFVEIAS